MKEIYVIFWSGTGNTEEMAKAVAEGIEAAGGKALVSEVGTVTPDVIEDVECFALGCPAMGVEELEEEEMEPFVAQIEGLVSGKKICLFGSYDWGDGEWMRLWAERMETAGAQVVGGEGIVANNTPDEDALSACRKLGKELLQ